MIFLTKKGQIELFLIFGIIVAVIIGILFANTKQPEQDLSEGCQSFVKPVKELVGSGADAFCAAKSLSCESVECAGDNTFFRCNELSPSKFDCTSDVNGDFLDSTTLLNITCCSDEADTMINIGRECVGNLLQEGDDIEQIREECLLVCEGAADRKGSSQEELDQCLEGIELAISLSDFEEFIVQCVTENEENLDNIIELCEDRCYELLTPSQDEQCDDVPQLIVESLLESCIISHSTNVGTCRDVCDTIFTEEESDLREQCYEQIHDIRNQPYVVGAVCYEERINEDRPVDLCQDFCENEYENNAQRERCIKGVDFAAYGGREEILDNIVGPSQLPSEECSAYQTRNDKPVEYCIGCCGGELPLDEHGNVIPRCCLQDLARTGIGCQLRPQETRYINDVLKEVTFQYTPYVSGEEQFKVWLDVSIDEDTNIARGKPANADRIGNTNRFSFFDFEGMRHYIDVSPNLICQSILESIDQPGDIIPTSEAEYRSLGGDNFALSCFPYAIVSVVVESDESGRIGRDNIRVMCSPVRATIE